MLYIESHSKMAENLINQSEQKNHKMCMFTCFTMSQNGTVLSPLYYTFHVWSDVLTTPFQIQSDNAVGNNMILKHKRLFVYMAE